VFITILDGRQYLYLLEGAERALLIDTAWGCGDLRSYVETLTSKPVVVVNTHGHIDHRGGNGWWPEVHMHADAAADADGPRAPDSLEVPYPDYTRVFVGDGHTFDLGGREVEVIEIGAHASGSIALLDRETRMLFCGDEVESGQVLLFDYGTNEESVQKRLIERHLGNMQKLQTRSSEYSCLCPAHNGAPIAASYVDDFVALDRMILEGRHEPASRSGHWYLSRLPFGKELRRASYGGASIIYRAAQA